MAQAAHETDHPEEREAVLPKGADLNPEHKEAPNAENTGVSRINTVSIALAVLAMTVIGAVALSSYY